MQKIYRNILKESFLLTWKNKYFWFFGFFASFISIASEYNVFSSGVRGDNGYGLISKFRSYSETGILSPKIFNNIFNLVKNYPVNSAVLFVMLVITLALLIFLVWLAIVSQVALVNNSAKIISKKNTSFKDGVYVGKNNFWKVLGFNILVKIIMSLMLIIIGLPLIFKGDYLGSAIANFIYIVLFIFLIPLGLVATFIIKYAIAYSVIKNQDFINSIKEGWNLFKNNWLVSIEIAILLYLVLVLTVILVLLAIFIMLIPILLLSYIFGYVISKGAFMVIFYLGVIFLILFLFLAGAVISAFQIVTWTNLFTQLTSKGIASKISRMTGKFIK